MVCIICLENRPIVDNDGNSLTFWDHTIKTDHGNYITGAVCGTCHRPLKIAEDVGGKPITIQGKLNENSN